MSKEERVRADRLLRENHHRKTLEWLNCKLDSTELAIMATMRSGSQDLTLIHGLINERENIKHKCKDTHKKIYG
jgi:hypothetical protein